VIEERKKKPRREIGGALFFKQPGRDCLKTIALNYSVVESSFVGAGLVTF
jgi:hypothetical protein